MSLITGYTKQITTAAADSLVTIRAASFPVISGQALQVPDQITVKARATDGFWQVVLGKGSYEISVKASNGQLAKVIITIPNEDLNTYSFEQLVVSELPSPSAPIGGAQPTASATVLGLIKSDELTSNPIAVTGVFWRANYASVRAIPSATNNKLCFVSGTEDAWDWSAASVAADDGRTVLKPDDTLVGNPGRWLKRQWVKTGSATLVGGTVVVPTIFSSATAMIVLQLKTPGGTVGFHYVSARSAGVSFTITSTNAADTSAVDWILFEP